MNLIYKNFIFWIVNIQTTKKRPISRSSWVPPTPMDHSSFFNSEIPDFNSLQHTNRSSNTQHINNFQEEKFSRLFYKNYFKTLFQKIIENNLENFNLDYLSLFFSEFSDNSQRILNWFKNYFRENKDLFIILWLKINKTDFPIKSDELKELFYNTALEIDLDYFLIDPEKIDLLNLKKMINQIRLNIKELKFRKADDEIIATIINDFIDIKRPFITNRLDILFEDCVIKEKTDLALTNLWNFSKLSSLAFYYCNIKSSFECLLLKYPMHFSMLKTLKFSASNIPKSVYENIQEALLNNFPMNELILYDLYTFNRSKKVVNQFSLFSLENNTKLKSLCVSAIQNFNIKNCNFKNAMGLKSLSLESNRLNSSNVKILLNSILASGINLTTLILNHNKLENEGIRYVSNFLINNKKLKRLDLVDVGVNNINIAYIIKALSINSSLNYLDLHFCELNIKNIILIFETVKKSNISNLIFDRRKFLIKKMDFNEMKMLNSAYLTLLNENNNINVTVMDDYLTPEDSARIYKLMGDRKNY